MGSRESLLQRPLLAFALACCACSSGASDPSGPSVSPPFGNAEAPAPVPAAQESGAASDTIPANPANEASPAPSAVSTSEPSVSPDLMLSPPPASAGGGDQN